MQQKDEDLLIVLSGFQLLVEKCFMIQQKEGSFFFPWCSMMLAFSSKKFENKAKKMEISMIVFCWFVFLAFSGEMFTA